MPGCLLVVRGHFDVDAALPGSGLTTCDMWREGEVDRVRKRARECSGFQVWASDEGTLQQQSANVIRFLDEHILDLRRIISVEGIQDARLDFGYDCRLGEGGVFMQGGFLPAGLIARSAELKLAIALSLYPSRR